MIPVYKPWLTDLEKKYVNEAIESSWISSTGKYVDRAEKLFADFVGTKHCIVATSGTTALHLAIRALELEEGSTVVIPNSTFAATGFAPAYERLNLAFADISPRTWNIDPYEVKRHCLSKNVSAVIPVHLYGNPADMSALLDLQKEFGFKIIEDACESLGATIDGKMTGSLGDAGCFSFYGNKTFTCGEGGALVTNDDHVAARARLLRGQAQDPNRRYWHIDIGHNYRLTNIQAAILCAQLERADEILSEKARVAERYHSQLEGDLVFQEVKSGHVHSNWLITAMIPDIDIVKFSEFMRSNGVDVRKTFYPMNMMPAFGEKGFYIPPVCHSTSECLSNSGISFPSYPELTDDEIDFICKTIKRGLVELEVKRVS